MGFASYLEDIRKIKDEVAHFRRLLDEGSGGEPTNETREVGRRIQGYRVVLDNIVSQFDQLLAIASEPEIELANEVDELKAKYVKAAAEADELRQQLRDCESARQKAVADFRAKLAERKAEAAVLKKRLREVEEAFENLAKENFGSAISIYPPEPKGR